MPSFRFLTLVPLAALLLVIPITSAAETGTPAPAYEEIFGGRVASFVATDMEGERIAVYAPERVAERRPPCSTFKIPHALIALDAGVIGVDSSFKAWDGESQPFRSWERDHELGSAIASSVVWYFQRIARDVGRERMQEHLDRIGYGNRDLSAGQTVFWLDSSLEISAEEQLGVLRRLWKDELPFAPEHQAHVRGLLKHEAPDGWELAGKTGTCGDWDGHKLAWFVGRVRAADGREAVFATQVEGDDVIGPRARAMSVEILRALGLLPPGMTETGPAR